MLLILTLRTNGCISVGDDIKIYNGQDFPVKICIDAPRHIPIVRDEAKDKTHKV